MRKRRPIIWHPTFDAWPLMLLAVIVAVVLGLCGKLK